MSKEPVRQPLFKMGDRVSVIVESKGHGMEFKNRVEGFIMEITMTSTATERTYKYGITKSMPNAYYSGDVPFGKFDETSIMKVGEEAL